MHDVLLFILVFTHFWIQLYEHDFIAVFDMSCCTYCIGESLSEVNTEVDSNDITESLPYDSATIESTG